MSRAYRITTNLLLLFTLILSCTALYFSYINNFILTYNDAASHLNIARRVIDNLTPGLAQIGTVWLPLPHLLMIPFAANDYLWHTGFAGSIISMLAFVLSVLFTYKTIFTVTKSVVGAIVGAFVMALNPNFLYIQTTPMTEPLLIATFCAAIYFLAKYLIKWEIQQLLIASIFVAGSTLIRYDGWFLFMFLAVLLPLWIWKWRGRHEAESSLILFLFMGGFGIVIWVLWNWLIFGDPMYFITGPYSAYAQQKILKEVGQLPTEGNIFNASYYYLWSVIDNNGILLFVSSAIVALIVPLFVSQKKYLLVILAALSPIIFNVIALYLGQSAMNVPQAPSNPGMFNVRYGMMALPFIALTLGILAGHKYLKYLVMLLLVVQSYLFIQTGIPISLADGLYGKQQTYYTVEASQWFRDHYTGGLILTSLASHDAFVARTQIPMKNYIHEGTRVYWKNSTVDPPDYVEYIATLSFPPDSVYRAIYQHPTFKDKYKLIHNYEKFEIYQRIRK
jgi:4-amino-4-deoxy-L-arabinose transferase-like glycosyltransferase